MDMGLDFCKLALRTLSTLFIVVTLSPAARAANTLAVCKQGCAYSTIQSAVDAAASGDKIQIGVGTFFENVRIDNKSLALLGSGEDLTTVDGGFKDSVFTITNSPTEKLSLFAMTITHGYGKKGGGGIYSQGLLDLENSIVVSNRTDYSGGGVFITFQKSGSQITKSIVSHNRAKFSGGGIYIDGETYIDVTGATVVRNAAGTGGGGIYLDVKTHSTIAGTSITENASGQDGAGILGGPGGGNFPQPAWLSISNSTIANNVAQGSGGGLVFAEGTATLSGVVISRNTAAKDGGGILNGYPDMYARLPQMTLTNAFVVQNSAAGVGGGIDASGPLTLTNATIKDNTPSQCVDTAGGCP